MNGYEKPYEHIAIKKDGTKFPVEIHGRTLADGLRLTAVRNMTRYKEVEQREELIFNELENKLHEWRQELSLKSIENRMKLEKITLNINSMISPEVQ
jgi:hypothetical protein